MVFPLSKVRLLSDYGGEFLLSVLCTACRHERPVAAATLAKRAGRSARVADVVQRLRCSACGARCVDVTVVGIPR